MPNAYKSQIKSFRTKKGKRRDVDFFAVVCKTSKNWNLFWVADSQDNQTQQAFITYDESVEGCVAKVDNSAALTFDFYAIDACLIIKKRNGDKISLCDALIITQNSIVFIELKDRNDKKEEKGIQQIESTIEQFVKAHPSFTRTNKIGYFCNKKFPNFGTSKMEMVEEINNKYGYRLRFKTNIVLV